MRKYSGLFLMLTILTGFISFIGLDFEGVEVVRVLFLVFADLLIVSLLARLILPKQDGNLQSVGKN